MQFAQINARICLTMFDQIRFSQKHGGMRPACSVTALITGRRICGFHIGQPVLCIGHRIGALGGITGRCRKQTLLIRRYLFLAHLCIAQSAHYRRNIVILRDIARNKRKIPFFPVPFRCFLHSTLCRFGSKYR